jgi:cystathionine gamma-lyase
MDERAGFSLTSSDHDDWGSFGFSTRAIHDGQEPDPQTGSVTVPIYQTSTYAQESPGKTKGYEYSRTNNPTRSALEKSIASLEKARFALAFSSGMGAILTFASSLRTGDRVLLGDDIYGGTYRIFTKVFSKFGVDFEFVDASDVESIRSALADREFNYVLIESPTNPLLKIVDIAEVSKISHEFDAKVVVDNTFATPYITNPLNLGADVVVHSTTKYLGGHSDLIGGAIATNDPKLNDDLRFLQNACGAVPGPFDCWLVLRGIKTLSLRMEKHSSNALKIASFLSENKGTRIKSINYPGLPGEQFDLAKKQMRIFGGMISFDLESESSAKSFLKSLKLFSTAESLGGVESLAEIPGIMTHASLPESERQAKGITNSLIRLSVGIEDEADLVHDVKQALKNA